MYQPYTYLVYDTVNHKRYIGSKYAEGVNPENTADYFGSPKSGVYRDVIDSRPHTLVKTVLMTWSTKEEAIEHEMLLHDIFEVDVNPMFYNKSKQTSTGFSMSGQTPAHFTPEHQRKVASLGGQALTFEQRSAAGKEGGKHWKGKKRDNYSHNFRQNNPSSIPCSCILCHQVIGGDSNLKQHHGSANCSKAASKLSQ